MGDGRDGTRCAASLERPEMNMGDPPKSPQHPATIESLWETSVNGPLYLNVCKDFAYLWKKHEECCTLFYSSKRERENACLHILVVLAFINAVQFLGCRTKLKKLDFILPSCFVFVFWTLHNLMLLTCISFRSADRKFSNGWLWGC